MLILVGMNSRQIEIFHAVMKTGSATGAARKIGITQPAVTAALKQLEIQLGFNLFHREAGRLQPTSEAHILDGEASRIQDSLLMFRRLANRLKKDMTTHLRISTPPALSHQLIPQAISLFTEKNRDCLIDISTLHHDQILSNTSEIGGANSLGFSFGLDGRRGLGSIPIGKVKIVALVPEAWPLASTEVLSVDSLAGLPMIGTYATEPLGLEVERLISEANVNLDVVVRAHNHIVAASLVEKGVGAALLDGVTATYAKQISGDRAFRVLPVEGAASLPVKAIYSYEHPLNDNARNFVDIFRHCFQQVAFDQEA